MTPATRERPGVRPTRLERADMPKDTREQRFLAKVDPNGPVPDYAPHLGPCWIWTAGRNAQGYGHIARGGGHKGSVGAHRMAHELFIGPIPDGYEVDHLCRVTYCVNPAHLEAVTGHENTLRSSNFIGVNARKTHCHRGHEFTPENTIAKPNGGRECRECQRYFQRLFGRKKRAEARAQPVPPLTCKWCGVSFQRPNMMGPAPGYCCRWHFRQARRAIRRAGSSQEHQNG